MMKIVKFVGLTTQMSCALSMPVWAQSFNAAKITAHDLPCDYTLESSGGEWIDAPAEFETVTEWTRMGFPGHDRDIVRVPAVYDADGNLISPASVTERIPPVEYKWVTRRIVKTPAGRRKTPKQYVLKDKDGAVAVEFDHTFDIATFRDDARYGACFAPDQVLD